MRRLKVHTVWTRTPGNEKAHRRDGNLWLDALIGFAIGLLAAGATHAAQPMVAMGASHALAVRSDGTVLTWGADTYGQLGLGRALLSPVPVKVGGLSQIKAVAAGSGHSLAVRADGTVWAWGSNEQFGKLGDGTTVDRPTPIQVGGVDQASDICAGGWHSAVLRRDGTVWAWGNNWHGQTGHGPLVVNSAPGPVEGLTDVTAIACYANQTFALKRDGTVWGWGANAQGGLGDGTQLDRATPVQVSGLTDVVAINGTAALRRDGTVWEWGYTTWSGKPANLVPLQSVGIADAAALGRNFGGEWGGRLQALQSDGTTWWQWTPGLVPEKQAVLGRLKALASSPFFSLLLKEDGQVLASGLNNSGQLGNGVAPSGGWDWQADFLPVVGLANVVAVTAGDNHALALDASGIVWAWGDDAHGQLGRGTVMSNTIANVVPGLSNIVQVSTGEEGSSFALDGRGRVWAWGLNAHGQLGDGTGSNRSSPVPLAGLEDVQALALGANWTSMALKKDGTVWAWGNNFSGQLGNGRSGDFSNTPTAVPGLTNVTAIAAHTFHALAVRQDGTVWAWGGNDNGQLGNGTTTASLVPIQVPGLSGVKAVAAGWARSFALKRDGTVMAWGFGNWGALGDGSWSEFNRLSPQPVPGLTDVVEISAGTHTLARRSDGSVWGWGQTWGTNELGGRAMGSVSGPVTSYGPFQGIAAGQQASALLSTDGLLYMAGDNTSGRLGDGTFANPSDWALAVSESVTDFLDLMPGTVKQIPAGLVPVFLVRTEKSGNLANLSLRANLRGLLGSGGLARSVRSAGYNVYVVALAGGTGDTVNWYQMDSQRRWGALTFPVAQYLSGVALAGRFDSILVEILDGLDVSALASSRFFVGYGTDALEMVEARRYREVMTIIAPK